MNLALVCFFFFFFQAEDGIRDLTVTGVQTCALPIWLVPEEWLIGLHALSVIVTNTSGGDLDIDWERCVFVDPAGRTHRTIHRGVQLNQLTSPMLSSRVAAGATINEFIFPAGGVRFNAPAGRSGSVWNSPAGFQPGGPGSRVSVLPALQPGAAPRPPKVPVFPVAPRAASP